MTDSALTIRITTPATAQPVSVAVSHGGAVLVGRTPELANLAPADASPPLSTRSVAVPGATVSGNHALVWCDGGAVVVRDLASRNGTWLLLPSGSTATLSKVAARDLVLDLARPASPVVSARPRDASWSDDAEFAPAVAREVERWLAAAGRGLASRLVRRSGRDDAVIPLTPEWGIRLIEPDGTSTISAAWDQMTEEILQYVHDQKARVVSERSPSHDPSFVMASPALWEAHRKVFEASSRALQLVLLGETGSGKGTLARCYHTHSDRGGGPFEVVNCAEIDKHFARTRIFGARKGAYTGCAADIAGAVECARGGTLFLDEVAELSLDVQGELLTFLDDQRYKRLGDDQWRQADVRVVCGTNSDLRKAVREGRFRGDLWYRIAGRVVVVPPLRERPEDLLEWLKSRAVSDSATVLSVYDALSPEARALVMTHPWRGNFRELEGFARRLPTAAKPGAIDVAQCRDALDEGALDDDHGAVGGPWEKLLASATRAYQRQSGAAPPARAPELREYFEEALKPLFFAQTLGMEGIDAVPDRPSPSYEEMARRMGCDAATVRSQLARYVEIRRAQSGR